MKERLLSLLFCGKPCVTSCSQICFYYPVKTVQLRPRIPTVLGIFPRTFSQRINSKCQFPKGQVRPSEAPQAATRAERCGQDRLGGRAPLLEHAKGRALRLGQTWEVVTWEVASWENAFGKVPNIYPNKRANTHGSKFMYTQTGLILQNTGHSLDDVTLTI